MLRAPNPGEEGQDGSILARAHVVTVRPALLWRLSNFPSSCESLLPWRRSPVACGLPLRYVPPLDVSSFLLPSDRMRASWSLPLVVSPYELRAYYSTRRDSSDAQTHARIVGIEESIGGIGRDCASWCAYSSWNIAVTRPEIRGSASPRIPIIAIQDDFPECQVPCRTARQLTPSQPRTGAVGYGRDQYRI